LPAPLPSAESSAGRAAPNQLADDLGPDPALAVLVLLAAGATTALPGFNRRYLGSLAGEIAKVQLRGEGRRRGSRVELTRKRTILLTFARSKADMDVLAETPALAPPVWLTSSNERAQVAVTGETDQAAPLLKTIDASPFSVFRIRVATGTQHNRRAVSYPNYARSGTPRFASMRELEPREKKALIALGAALAVSAVVFIYEFWPAGSAAPEVASTQSVAQMEQRLARAREIAATVPAKQEILKKVTADLEAREKSLIRPETLNKLRHSDHHPARIGSCRGPAHRDPRDRARRDRPSATITALSMFRYIDCRIEQLLNFRRLWLRGRS
jgi:hypothetical protein